MICLTTIEFARRKPLDLMCIHYDQPGRVSATARRFLKPAQRAAVPAKRISALEMIQ